MVELTEQKAETRVRPEVELIGLEVVAMVELAEQREETRVRPEVELIGLKVVAMLESAKQREENKLRPKTHNIATAMTGSTTDRGTTSINSTAEGLGMAAALTDLNGGSAKQDTSLKRPEKALWSPNATLLKTVNSGLVSMTTENS
ncbi:hypothetical protein ROHU_006137 [Labeo rohita]|uniref:Uncharacterized protein n=1 Tax=Labeo rohita TaxID=84645 RepID=A0A498MVA3_LABRO|nr:hypothetical protein ROHU_006137 [Labeo rohita]